MATKPRAIRLHHPTLRNAFNTIEDTTRPLKRKPGWVPTACRVCDVVHTYKTYHLWFDSVGDVEVSEEIYAHLRRIGLAEIKDLGTTTPTPQVLDMGATPEPVPVISREKGLLHG